MEHQTEVCLESKHLVANDADSMMFVIKNNETWVGWIQKLVYNHRRGRFLNCLDRKNIAKFDQTLRQF